MLHKYEHKQSYLFAGGGGLVLMLAGRSPSR